MRVIRTYSSLTNLKTFHERFDYLKLGGSVGQETFGFDRIFNQKFYNSYEWKKIRDYVIVRDNGCDLGTPDYNINGKVIIHHLNPITLEDISKQSDYLLNPEYLICTSIITHNAIHYGDDSLLPKPLVVRSQNDTCPWRVYK